MYNVMVINDKRKARIHTKTNSISKATQLVRELQGQGQRAYIYTRKDKE